MNDVGLNFEIWTLPNSGDFKRKADITPWVVDRNLDVRFLDISSGAIAVHNTCPYLDEIITIDSANHANDVGSTLMLFRGGEWLAAFVVVEREDRSSETQPYTTFGVEGLEWFLERARVRAWDYPADPIREGDWLYGAPSILKVPGGEISNDITNIYREASVTSGSFTVTDGSSTSTTTVPWDDDGTDLKTAVEELTAVSAATVYGIGTEDFPWVIEITNPAGTPFTITIAASTLDGDLFVNPIRQGGDYSPRPWHGSVDSVAGVTIGGYEGFELVTPGGVHPASSSDFILHLDGAAPSAGGDNPGAQIEANVIGGHRYRAALRLNSPDIEMELRLSVRDLSNNTIASIDYTLNPAQGWVTVPIVDPANPGDPAGIFTMPDVSTVYVRVGILAEEGVNPGSLYVDVLDTANTYLAPGDAAKTWGDINTDLLAPITARGVLDWVTPTWSATLDSSGVAWDADRAMGIRRGQTYYQVQEYGRRWGYEWTLTYNGGAVTPFDFGLYNPGNAGTDYTGLGGPSISSIDGMVDGGVKVFRAPDATYAIAEGDAGAWGESTDAVLAAGWGRLESYFANRQNREGLSTLAARMVTDSAQQATGRRVRVQNPSNTPLDTIKIADTVPTVLPTAAGPTETLARRVMGVTIGQSDEPAPFYDFHLDSMVFDPEAAEADGLRTLIRAYEALDNLGPGGGIDPLFTFQPPPPASVYTDPGPATLGNFTQGTDTGGTSVPAPSSVAGDRIYLFLVQNSNTQDITADPAGFTLARELGTGGGSGVPLNWLHYMDVVSPPSTITLPTGTGGGITFAWQALTIRGGSSYTHSSGFAAADSNNNDPPAVSPTDAPGDYLVVTFNGMNQDDGVGTEPGGSTGYTKIAWEDAGSGSSPRSYTQQRAVTIATSENPDAYAYPSDGIGNFVTAVTIAVKYTSAPLAEGDHTHLESDITDLDHWTEADHDALDHTGLTGVGGGSGSVPEWMELLATPASADADDDEFADGTITGWTAVNASASATPTWTEDDGLLSVVVPVGDGAADLHAQVKAMTIATGSFIETHIRAVAIGGFPHIGLIMADGASAGSGQQVVGGVEINSRNMICYDWSNYDTRDATTASRTYTASPITVGFYLRLHHVSANSFLTSISIDGVSWFDTPSAAITCTPTHAGVVVASWSGTFLQASFEYFRQG